MAPLIPLLIQAASAVPALMKFVGVGEASTKIAEDVVAIAQAVTGVQDPQAAIEQAITNREFTFKVNEQLMRWEAMYLADVDSARKRDAALAQAGVKNSRANWMLASAYVGVAMCFFAIFGSALGEFEKSILTLILGRMLGYIDQAFNFEFGTTRSSKEKDGVIDRLTK